MKRIPFVLSIAALNGLAAAPMASASNFDSQLAQCVRQVEFCQELSFDKKKCQQQADQVSKCSAGSGSGTLCRLALDDIRPTQYSVGGHVAACKAKKIKKWDGQKGEKSLHNRLLMSNRQVPAVIGPVSGKKKDPGFYITDHHHLSYAMYLAHKNGYTKADQVYICVLENRAQDSEDSFWDFMTANRFVWLDDNKAEAIHVSDLPDNLSGLADYPFRSWSRWVRDSCGYLKEGKDCVPPAYPAVNAYFMEFKWADYLEQNMSGAADIDKMSDAQIAKQLADHAIPIAQGRQAFLEGLPGYSDGSVVPVQPVKIKDGCEQ